MSGHEPSPPETGEPRGFSLRRWSQRKHAAAREQDRASEAPAQQPGPATPEAPAALATGMPGAMADRPPPTDAPAGSSAELSVVEPAPQQAAALPPIESLTPGSDFAAFMRPGVDESLKRGALKQLFTDPHFNVMDGLDIYIDDYTRPDPIEPSVARQLLARITLDTSASAPAPAGDPVAAPAVVSAPPAPVTAESPSDGGGSAREAASEAVDEGATDASGDAEALAGDTEALPGERDAPPTPR